MGLVRASAERFEGLRGYDHEANYVDVGGPEMAYVDVDGDGDETFLCLHGEPTWSYLYRKMIPVLSEAGRIIAPDFVGFGRSDKWESRDAYTFDSLYDTLETFVEELDLTDVTLVCQDWGGILGLPLAARNPDRFARLVPMNTLLPDGTQTMPDVWHQFKQMAETAPEFDASRIVTIGCATELEAEIKDAYRAPFPDESHTACAREFPGLVPIEPDMPGADAIGEARDLLSEWEKPVFVLFSDSDPIMSGFRDDLLELFPTADNQPDTWIEGAGHFLQEDAGEAVAEEILAFVDRT